MNKESILFTNVGRRGKLMMDFIESVGDENCWKGIKSSWNVSGHILWH